MKLILRITHNSNTYTNKPGNDIVITHVILFVKKGNYKLQCQHSGVTIQSEDENQKKI